MSHSTSINGVAELTLDGEKDNAANHAPLQPNTPHQQSDPVEQWDSQRSRELYRVADWGQGYFGINDEGHVTVRPNQAGRECDLYDLIGSLERRDIQAPILFRFDGIIRDRTRKLQSAFFDAIKEHDYDGDYTIAFPLKVNPQGHVVETIRNASTDNPIGLEVGSKPELLAVLSLPRKADSLLLCNGYKDEEYIELALMARKLGRRSIIIIEQYYELAQVLAISDRLGIEPELGIRIKPATKGSGMWEASSGERAKFGLTTHQLLRAIDDLECVGKINSLTLLHFHIGSQLPSLMAYRRVLKEAARVYVELARRCPALRNLDVGGGLGVDYDGSKSTFEASMSYSVREYAESIVSAVAYACRDAGVAEPNLISESGRALVAHHAILVTEVIDVAPGINGSEPPEPSGSEPEPVARLYALWEKVTLEHFQEILNETVALRGEILDQFIQGSLSIEDRAKGEHLVKLIVQKLVELSPALRFIPEELEALQDNYRDTFFCNFSLFQSMLDSWAIDQLFPIMPIQQLCEQPTRKATLADLTCDSDGEIKRFIDLEDVSNHVLCHMPNYDTPQPTGYYVGVFLVGAYQEILGGLHNLFGDTNAVHVDVGEDGAFEITEVVAGDTVSEVLDYVEYNVPQLIAQFRASLERSIKAGILTPEESARYRRKYREVLDGYTYLVK